MERKVVFPGGCGSSGLRAVADSVADELTEQRVTIAFAERYFADVEEGRLHPLEHYLALFPGHDAVIRQEFDLLSERRRVIAWEGAAPPPADWAG